MSQNSISPVSSSADSPVGLRARLGQAGRQVRESARVALGHAAAHLLALAIVAGVKFVACWCGLGGP